MSKHALSFNDVVQMIRLSRPKVEGDMHEQSVSVAIKCGILISVSALKDCVPVDLLHSAAVAALNEFNFVVPER